MFYMQMETDNSDHRLNWHQSPSSNENWTCTGFVPVFCTRVKVSEGLLLPEGILPLTLATYAFSGLEKYCCINKNKWKSGFTRQSLSNVQISFVLPSPIYHTAMCKYCYKIRSLLLQSQDIAAVIKWRRIARGNYQISYYQKLKHKFKKQNKTKQVSIGSKDKKKWETWPDTTFTSLSKSGFIFHIHRTA